jgi:hypothetical protein
MLTACYSKNKFKKLVHLVGFIIRMEHDARSSDCQITSILEGRNSKVFAKREHSVTNNNRKMAQKCCYSNRVSKKITSAKLLLNRTKLFSNETHDKLDF